MPSKQELLDQIADLEDENQSLQDRLDAVADLVTGDDEPDTEADGENGEEDDDQD